MIFFYLGTDAGTRTRTVTRLQIASLAVSAQKLNKYLKSAEHIGNPRVDKILKSLDEGNQKKFKNLSSLKLSKINLRSRNTRRWRSHRKAEAYLVLWKNRKRQERIGDWLSQIDSVSHSRPYVSLLLIIHKVAHFWKKNKNYKVQIFVCNFLRNMQEELRKKHTKMIKC